MFWRKRKPTALDVLRIIQAQDPDQVRAPGSFVLVWRDYNNPGLGFWRHVMDGDKDDIIEQLESQLSRLKGDAS